MELIVRRYGTPEARITLAPADFLASGGQGEVHARDGVAYKIYADPASMPPDDKWAILRRLTDPRLVTPSGTLHALDGRPVGICMPLVADATPIARLATESFRRQHGIGGAQVLGLLEATRQALAAAHQAAVHVVDLNPYNVLVTAGAADVAVIDADSWQTPRHPATAVLDAVRDRHAQRFDARSDWFSFAVLAAWTLLGVHPYKGTHPTLQGLDARMRANASIFGSGVRVPPSARDPDDLPAAIRAWLVAVLERGERDPPPAFDGSGFRFVARPDRPSLGLALTEVACADAPVEACGEAGGVLWWITRSGVYRAGRRIAARPPGQVALALGARALVAGASPTGLVVIDASDGAALRCDLAARAVTAAGAALVALTREALVRLRPVGRLIAPEVIARVGPATRLFDGVAIQPLPGGVEAIVPLPAGGVARLRLPVQLSRILAARADGGVLRVVGADRAWTARLDGRRVDLREEPADCGDADLICLPSGLALIRQAGDVVCLEPAAPGAHQRRAIQDPAWGAEARLVRLDAAVGLVRGRRVWRARLR